MRPLVIYHKGCMDGAGAALAAYLKFGENAEYRPASYGDPAPTSDEVRGRDVFIVDFSYPRAELERMREANYYQIAGAYSNKLVVLDHHKTAQKDLEELPFCVFDMNKSGAAMAWEYFHCSGLANPPDDSRLPELIRYIQDRDLWRWQLRYSKEISAALFSTGATEEFRKLLPYIVTDVDVAELALQGTAILRTEAQMVARVVSTAEEVDLAGHRCLAVSCPLLQSEIGEALAIESARRGLEPIGVVWHRNGAHGGIYRVSLRSRDVEHLAEAGRIEVQAPDVSAIARQIDPNGGGHHRAAGFECARLPWDTHSGAW